MSAFRHECVVAIPNAAQKVIAYLEAAGFQAYIVGGCVRDSLMGKVPHDWDICTNALPDDVIRIFGANNTIPTGLKHGTVTVNDGGQYEVTTFRIDGKYLDGRHPDSVRFVRSLAEDLARRDFTINAMAYNPATGLVDIFGGENDIQKGVIRAVGEPRKRFQEDALRILRAVRFSAKLGFAIESQTYEAMGREICGLDKVSAERIGSEILQIVTAPFAKQALSAHNGMVIRYVIPELGVCYGVEQNNRYHHEDVFYHIISTLGNAETCHQFPDEWADKYVRMALLLHDIGKPQCKTTDENGYDHFYKHAPASAELAEKVLRRLRYSNEFIDTVVELIRYHDAELVPTKACARRLLNKLGVDQLHRLLKLRECDNRAHTSAAWVKFNNQTVPFAEVLQQVLDEESAFKLKDLAINGKDLIAAGYKPGKNMGRVLDALLEEVINEQIQNDKATLLHRAKALYLEWPMTQSRYTNTAKA